MIDAKKLSELLAQVKNGNQKAYAELSRQYAPMLENECKKRVGQSEYDDLYQAALMALYSAACSFDSSREGITFGLYAQICVRRRLDGELRRAGKNVDEPIDENEISPAATPEEELISRENYRVLLDSIDRTLTEAERSVFLLYLADKSYAEIARILGRTEKSVDGALRRAKEKLRKINGRQ